MKLFITIRIFKHEKNYSISTDQSLNDIWPFLVFHSAIREDYGKDFYRKKKKKGSFGNG